MGRDFRIPETVKFGSGSGLTGPFGSYSLFAPGAHRLRVSEFMWEYFNRHQGWFTLNGFILTIFRSATDLHRDVCWPWCQWWVDNVELPSLYYVCVCVYSLDVWSPLLGSTSHPWTFYSKSTQQSSWIPARSLGKISHQTSFSSGRSHHQAKYFVGSLDLILTPVIVTLTDSEIREGINFLYRRKRERPGTGYLRWSLWSMIFSVRTDET